MSGTPPRVGEGVPGIDSPARSGCGEGWVLRLRAGAAHYEDAVGELHALMLRAARHQVARTPWAYPRLGTGGVEEIVHSAADEATMAVLARLDSFEGRSRFTTWAYKFGILHAAVELRRADWRHVRIDLAVLGEQASSAPSPQQHAESADLARAVRTAIDRVLTDHQRAVAMALLVEEVPIDVLAERLGSTRNALYKTLHDARKRLRAELTERGYLTDPTTAEEVTP